MRNHWKFSILLVSILIILLFLPGAIIAQDPLRSPEVYSLFLDWLNGKSMGLVTLRVVPVDENGSLVSDVFVFYLHNFTDYWYKQRSERIYEGKSQNIAVKLWRLLDRFNNWKEQEFTIVVVGKNYFGTKLIKIKPEKPLLSLEEKVVVGKIQRQKKLGFYNGKSKSLIQGPLPDYEVATATELTNAVQLHTIQGIAARIHFFYGNYLYFSQKSRAIEWDPNENEIYIEYDWTITGAKATPCGDQDLPTVSISDGDKRWVQVYVHYKYERWPAGISAGRYVYYELETPVDFGGWKFGDSIDCSLCEGKPSGWYEGYPQGTRIPISRPLGPGIEQIETTGAKVTFSVSYGYVTVTVELWKEISNGTNTSPPALEITSVNWQNKTLYAFEAGSNWKIIHFTWTPP